MWIPLMELVNKRFICRYEVIVELPYLLMLALHVMIGLLLTCD